MAAVAEPKAAGEKNAGRHLEHRSLLDSRPSWALTALFLGGYSSRLFYLEEKSGSGGSGVGGNVGEIARAASVLVGAHLRREVIPN